MDAERLKLFKALDKGLREGSLSFEASYNLEGQLEEMSIVHLPPTPKGKWVFPSGGTLEFSGKSEEFKGRPNDIVYVDDDEMLLFTKEDYSAILDALPEEKRQELLLPKIPKGASE